MAVEVQADFMTPDRMELEVVERKGLGHPDTLTDGIVEASEIAYAQYCRERFGAIPHHNLDKASLLGGLCIQQFGGSKFEAPVRMLFMGRASKTFAGEAIPLEEIQDETARSYLARIMPHLDTADPEVYQSQSLTTSRSTRPFWFSPRSIDDLPEYSGDAPRANDTATMISYWPLTKTEELALDLEGYFYRNNSDGLPEPRFSFIGQDIKVMCVRNGSTISATLCVPQVATETPSEKIYYEREDEISSAIQAYAEDIIGDEYKVTTLVNSQTKGPNPHPYMVTGGSCTDFGEEGAVGRGNKTHGIISSFRPNTMEAPHGKNPTYFVGKVLGFQADLIARSIHERLGTPSQVVLQANMGDSLFDPSHITVSTEDDVAHSDVISVVADCLGLGRQTTDLILDNAHFLPKTNVWRAPGNA